MRDILNRAFFLSRREPGKPDRQITKRYPSRVDVAPVTLADGFMSVYGGAFLLSRPPGEAQITVQRLCHCKTRIELLFHRN